MADFFLSNLKSTLDNCITELDEIHSMFCRNSESDFTRNRKLSFREYIQFMLQMQSKSVSNEILDFFEHSLSAPSKSAFTQQRYKLLPEGWNFLFHSFVNQCRTLSDNLYNGYRLLACDGSDVNISHNPADERTFIHEGEKGYNAIHINALYDITNKTYCDFLVQGKKKLHERSALNTMIDRYSDPVRAILMADRGYESFNTFAHLIRKGMYFVIRMKDINSNGILSAYDLPDSEFDTHIRIRKKHWGILTPILYFSLLPILIFLMKTVCITILNSGLYVFALIMEPISVLPPIFQKKNFLWKKSKNFTGCAGARKQASVNSNTPSV